MKTETTFAGLSLRNPIIAASSSRTNSAKSNLALDQAGVGAIVLKSLFEENILQQSEAMSQNAYGEGADYLQGYLRSHELSEYLDLIKESKSLCSVPIIASINAVSHGEWEEFAKLIEEAGADALELNVMGVEYSTEYVDGGFEQRHIAIAKSVCETVKIPVIMKLSGQVTNPVALSSKLKACGVAAVVMFNRLYQSDIDVESMEYVPSNIFAQPLDITTPLRWVAIASAKVSGVDFALSGGVKDGDDVIKSILAGATAVQVCSAIYKDGNSWIGKALERLESWQADHGYDSVSEYCGNMNFSGSEEQEVLMRSQFLRHLGSM